VAQEPAKPATEGKAAAQPAAAQPAAVQPAAAPVLCPVTKAPVDRKIAARFRNKWVYFANEEAKAKFEKSPLDFAEGVQAQWQADPPLRLQVKCPVTGELPSPEVFVGTGETAVFFASPQAREKWNKDPKPYQKKLEAECYTFQTGCATCKMEIKPDAAVQAGGKTVYFCCMGCAKEFDAKKAEYLKRVEEQVKANQTAYITRQFEVLLKMQAEQEAKAGQGKPAQGQPGQSQPAPRQ
jgi:YHS domain-containing protein